MYRHSSILILRPRGEDALLMLSREGVTRGDPLTMVLYALCIAPLAKHVREEVTEFLQPWYADDCCLAGRTWSIAQALAILEEYGPGPCYVCCSDVGVGEEDRGV